MKRLGHMSVFAHIVEQGSITAAAEYLHLSKSVISQHLKTLETQLGVTLLVRTTRTQSLTVAGKAFYAHCRDINDLADSAWQQARDTLEEPQGAVKITAPDALMVALIVPAITAVMQCYSKLDIELISSDQQLPIISADIDLAIRVGQSNNSSLKQRRIGEFRDLLCASKALISQGVNRNTLYIANQWQGSEVRHLFRNKQADSAFEYIPTRLCKVDSLNTSMALIKEGAGIGLIPDFLREQSKEIIDEVFTGYHLAVNPIYALHPFKQQMPLSVEVCLKAIEQRLRRVA